jgi:hypothetical protein
VCTAALYISNISPVLMDCALLLQLLLVFRQHVLLVLAQNSGSSRLDVLGVKRLLVDDGLDPVLRIADVRLPSPTTIEKAHLMMVDVRLFVNGLSSLGVFPGQSGRCSPQSSRAYASP